MSDIFDDIFSPSGGSSSTGGSGGTPLGAWAPSTNTPTLPNPPTSPEYNAGDYYLCTDSGTQFNIDFSEHDKIIATQDGDSLIWGKEEGGAVNEVNGISPDGTGNVSLNQDNIPAGTTNAQFSNTEKTKLAGIEDGATANTGDVTGPESSSDSNIPTFSGATGKTIQDSGININDLTTTAYVDSGLSGKEDSLGFVPENAAKKGVADGYAELDGTGKVPSSQLPAFVDDILEYPTLGDFPASGEDGKLYLALDTSLLYRWSGSQYSKVSPSLALGETSSTAYRGDRGKAAYDHSQLTSGNPHGVTKSDVGLSNVENIKNDFTYTSDPTNSDDASQGFSVGSIIGLSNTKAMWLCEDATAGSAVWTPINTFRGEFATSGDLPTPGQSGWHATVRATNTIWVYDTSAGQWVDSDQSGQTLYPVVAASGGDFATMQAAIAAGHTRFAVKGTIAPSGDTTITSGTSTLIIKVLENSYINFASNALIDVSAASSVHVKFEGSINSKVDATGGILRNRDASTKFSAENIEFDNVGSINQLYFQSFASYQNCKFNLVNQSGNKISLSSGSILENCEIVGGGSDCENAILDNGSQIIGTFAISGTWDASNPTVYSYSGSDQAIIDNVILDSSQDVTLDIRGTAKNYIERGSGSLSFEFADGNSYVEQDRKHPKVNDFALSLSGAPYAVNDIASSSTIYLHPNGSGNAITLWNGSRWVDIESDQVTYDLSTNSVTADKNYDIFAFINSSGNLELELSTAWTNDSTRSESCSIQDGAWCKASDKTRRLIGSFRSISTTTSCDTKAKRYLASVTRQKPLSVANFDSAISWAASGTAYRPFNGNNANAVEVLSCLDGSTISLSARADGVPNSGSLSVGIGINSTSVNSADIGGWFTNIASQEAVGTATLNHILQSGLNKFYPLEKSSSGSGTWYSTNGDNYKNGLSGSINF